MLAPITNILPQAVVQRLRVLPRAGQVKVRQGQTVRATDVVAVTSLEPKHVMLDASSGLGVSRANAREYIERYEGEMVVEGDVIARKTGLFSRVVRSPVAGKIVLMTDGYIFIEVVQEQFQLQAGIPGEVKELVHEMGAVIETVGALIQGSWGNGKIDTGVLNVMSEQPDEMLLPEQIDIDLRGAILMAGRVESADIFRRAADQNVQGMILGSIPSELIPTARRLPYPLLLTDGFGNRPMNSAAFRLLLTSNRRDVALNAEPFDVDTAARPEVLIPLPAAPQVENAPAVGRLEAGQRVRVTRDPHRGVTGKIESIPPGKSMFSNGLRLQAVKIRLESGEFLLVPQANVEIVNVRS